MEVFQICFYCMKMNNRQNLFEFKTHFLIANQYSFHSLNNENLKFK